MHKIFLHTSVQEKTQVEHMFIYIDTFYIPRQLQKNIPRQQKAGTAF